MSPGKKYAAEQIVSLLRRLRMRVELARAQYLLGKAVTFTGKSKEAASHYQAAARILQSLSKQGGVAHPGAFRPQESV